MKKWVYSSHSFRLLLRSKIRTFNLLMIFLFGISAHSSTELVEQGKLVELISAKNSAKYSTDEAIDQKAVKLASGLCANFGLEFAMVTFGRFDHETIKNVGHEKICDKKDIKKPISIRLVAENVGIGGIFVSTVGLLLPTGILAYIPYDSGQAIIFLRDAGIISLTCSLATYFGGLLYPIYKNLTAKKPSFAESIFPKDYPHMTMMMSAINWKDLIPFLSSTVTPQHDEESLVPTDSQKKSEKQELLVTIEPKNNTHQTSFAILASSILCN